LKPPWVAADMKCMSEDSPLCALPSHTAAERIAAELARGNSRETTIPRALWRNTFNSAALQLGCRGRVVVAVIRGGVVRLRARRDPCAPARNPAAAGPCRNRCHGACDLAQRPADLLEPQAQAMVTSGGMQTARSGRPGGLAGGIHTSSNSAYRCRQTLHDRQYDGSGCQDN
jgi:hypothetical protein